MKLLLIMITSLLLSAVCASSPTPTETIVDYLRTQPATATGSIRFGAQKVLATNSLYEVRVVPTKTADTDISYSFSERHIRLTTPKALVISVLGIRLHVREISFDAGTGKFTVRTNTPLGIGAETVSEKVAEYLEREYKPRLIQAMQELRRIRSERTLSDAQSTVDTIVKIFTSGHQGEALPPISGSIDLNFRPEEPRALVLDQLRAQIAPGDGLSAGVNFTLERGRFQIHAVSFSSYQGVRITRGTSSLPEFASVNLRSVKLGPDGVAFDYDIGAEESIAAFSVLIQVIQNYTEGPGHNCTNCQARLEAIRAGLDQQMLDQIRDFIRRHRPQLLAGGASPVLLNALD